MVSRKKYKCFFSHDNDEVALTSKGYFWSLSSSYMTNKSISVLPSDYKELPKNIAGICSDNIGFYKNDLQSK